MDAGHSPQRPMPDDSANNPPGSEDPVALVDDIDTSGRAKPCPTSLVDEIDTSGNVFRLAPAGAPKVAYTRDLTEADLAAPRTGTPPRTLLRIHASHHALARCLAMGMRPSQVALVTGYTPGRIAALSRDPAFDALVADYRREANSAFADLGERMAQMSLDAMEVLQERLHDNPETFTINVLLDVIKTFADRTGHGPNQTIQISQTRDLIDRPPRETREEWLQRRMEELRTPPKLIN